MHYGILLQMRRVSEKANEHVLGGDMDVETGAHEQADETNSVRDLLDGASGAAQRWRGNPFTTPAVNNQTEGEVRGADDAHAEVHSLVVVSRLLHLRDDRKESRGSGSRAEDSRGRSDAGNKGWVANHVVSKLVVTRLGGSSRSVEGCDSDTVKTESV